MLENILIKVQFDRLTSYDDITYIKIEYEEDGKVETLTYLPLWIGDDGQNNDAQDTVIGRNGNLYIKIGKKDFVDYFGEGFSNSTWYWGND